jgi:hypothetical protein
MDFGELVDDMTKNVFCCFSTYARCPCAIDDDKTKMGFVQKWGIFPEIEIPY